MSVMNGFRSELINKITNFNAHVIVKPYGKKIEQKKIDNEFLKNISSNLILSNNGEGILLNNEITKGILVRGYFENDFQKLKFGFLILDPSLKCVCNQNSFKKV